MYAQTIDFFDAGNHSILWNTPGKGNKLNAQVNKMPDIGKLQCRPLDRRGQTKRYEIGYVKIKRLWSSILKWSLAFLFLF